MTLAAKDKAPPPRSQTIVRQLLGKPVICTLDDGRTAKGTLICIDRLKNIILSQVVEERLVDASIYSATTTTPSPSRIDNKKMVTTHRFLSQAMIPGEHLVKVEIARSLYQSVDLE